MMMHGTRKPPPTGRSFTNSLGAPGGGTGGGDVIEKAVVLVIVENNDRATPANIAVNGKTVFGGERLRRVLPNRKPLINRCSQC
jgi:hypothetical protein